MKHINKVLVCVALSILLPWSGIGQKTSPQIRIMSYNIRHASPPSKPAPVNVDTIAAVIKKYKPHLVALQEVDVHTGRSGKMLHQAKAIADQTNMHYFFGKAINHDGGEYGIAILSKYPIDSAMTYALPSANAGAERRAVILAYLRIEGGKKMVFACTHLDAEKNDDSRLLQIKTIDSLLRSTTVPVVLAGDLNAEPGSPVIQWLDQHYKRSCVENCAPTFSNVNPTKIIDYIAFRQQDPFVVLSHSVLPEIYPSDHLPMMAELKWMEKKKDRKN